MSRPVKLLYFIGVDWFFYSHFLDRAIAAKEAGYDVVVLTGVTRDDDLLAKHGIKLIGIPFARRSIHPIRIMRNLRDVIRVYRAEKPDIVHQIALKPILVGSLAARIVGVERVINAVVGLGYAFSSQTLSARAVRFWMALFFKAIFKASRAKTVFENGDDRTFFLEQGWVRKQDAVLIRGAGVDTERFKPSLRSLYASLQNQVGGNGDAAELPIVMLLSRMLWDKGVGEFVEAARWLRRKHGDTYARFVLVGNPDNDNRGSISFEQMLEWGQEGVIEWWGFRPDVENVLGQASISCLPSYREGLPKSLLESLAMGLPCVATDVPGCREAVIDGVNGILVPPRESMALAEAIDFLIKNPALRQRYGRVSREMAIEHFSRDIVNRDTLALYKQLLGHIREN